MRSHWLYPAVTVGVLLLVWQALTASGVVASYLLPPPVKVAGAIVRTLGDGSLMQHLVPTLTASALGWLFGGLLATVLAALVTEFVWVERALLLHLLGLQAIPKVSLAPLVFLWAGFGLTGNVILVTLICFFPVFANALAGFRSVNPSLLDLLRAAGASRFHIWWHAKLPSAAPALFSGLEVSVAFALIGCVVMEFIGATRGLGFVIQDASNTFDLPLSFAAVVTLGAIGMIGNALLRLLRRWALKWELAGRRPGAEDPAHG